MATVEFPQQATPPTEQTQPDAPETQVVSAEQTAPRRIEVIINEGDLSIGDMAALDRMGASAPGAFADGIDVLAKFVVNEDVYSMPLSMLKPLADAVFEEVGKVGNPGN